MNYADQITRKKEKIVYEIEKYSQISVGTSTCLFA